MRQKTFILLLLLIGVFSNNIQAQSSCATIETPEERARLMKLKPFLDDYKKSDEILYIPIKFHDVARSDGDGRWTTYNIIQNLADINEDNAEYGIQFYLDDLATNKINNTNLYDHEEFGVNGIMNANNENGVVNVYMVQTAAGACGYYTYGADCIVIAKGCAEPASTTLTHELGHYFGLPHTFSGWEGGDAPNNNQIEKVAREGSGSNCNFAGDSFCGTGPDYASDRWGCPYFTLTDPDGFDFTPDSSFYMSYSLDECQSRHSFDQVASMKANIDNYRSYLKNHDTEAAQNTDEIGNIYLVYPVNEATVPPNITVEWEPVEGATHYALYAADVNNPVAIFDGVTTETSYTFNNLEDGDRIVWKVRPFHQGNYNAFAPFERRFNVSDEQIITVEDYTVTHPSCFDAEDASISIEVGGGTAPYEIIWDDGTTGNTLTDLPWGNYNCTVTDANDVSNVLKFIIERPFELESDVVVGFNSSTASGTGGTQPYNYTWSTTTETTKTALFLQPGPNTVTVTDANGCSSETEFTLIVPNVIVSNVTCLGDNNGSLFIFGAQGGEGSYDYEWSDGSTELVRNDLPAGDYTLYITDEAGNTSFGTYTITEASSELQIAAAVNGNDIIVEYAGGVEPVSFKWNDGSTEQNRTDLEAGNYTVTITDANGCKISSQTLSVTNTPTDNALLGETSINAFINANDILVFDIQNSDKNANIKLFNIAGKQVVSDNLAQGTNSKFYDLNNLPSGIYILQVLVGNEMVSLKLVK